MTFSETPESHQLEIYLGCSNIVLDAVEQVIDELTKANAEVIDLYLILEMVEEICAKRYGKRLREVSYL